MWKSSPSPQAHNCFQAPHHTQLPAEAAKSVVLGLPCSSSENLRTGRKAVRFCRVEMCQGALRAPGLGLPIVSRYACDLWGASQAQGLPKGWLQWLFLPSSALRVPHTVELLSALCQVPVSASYHPLTSNELPLRSWATHAHWEHHPHGPSQPASLWPHLDLVSPAPPRSSRRQCWANSPLHLCLD